MRSVIITLLQFDVHNYSINDSLKIILDNCFHNVDGKFFTEDFLNIGSKKLSINNTSKSNLYEPVENDSVTKIIVTRSHNDFENDKIISKNVLEWMYKFCEEFCLIGKKLIS